MNRKEEIGKIIDNLDKAMAKFQDARTARNEVSKRLKSTGASLRATAEMLSLTIEHMNELDSATDEANSACREAIRKTLELYNSDN